MSRALTAGPVLVAGLGISGAAAASALLRAGTDVLAVDGGAGPAVADRAARLRAAGAEVRTGLGALDPRLLSGMSLVVPSPGMAEHEPLLAEALRAGLPVWSEPELAWRLNGGASRLVAVTGTNGKTSTTELVAACLDAPAAGNIGAPLVEVLAGDAPPPLVVAELSSFQLRFCHTLRPDVAVLLNLAPDHLDWHPSLAAYAAAKARIWQAQRRGDCAVVNADDPGVGRVLADHPPPGRVVRFRIGAPGEEEVGVEDDRIMSRVRGAAGFLAPVDGLGRFGAHHLANVAAALAAALCAGAAPETLAEQVGAYRPGPNRLEQVAVVDGVAWFNDSKATNPHAAAAALSAFDSVVWIAGGLDKGLDFSALTPLLRERVRAAITIGAAGPQIATLTRGLGITTVEAGQLDAAVRAAGDLAAPGDTVLLAPACASMDQFVDYAARGEAFRQAVRSLHTEELPSGH